MGRTEDSGRDTFEKNKIKVNKKELNEHPRTGSDLQSGRTGKESL